jgi:hypothetical protein
MLGVKAKIVTSVQCLGYGLEDREIGGSISGGEKIFTLFQCVRDRLWRPQTPIQRVPWVVSDFEADHSPASCVHYKNVGAVPPLPS